LIGQLACFDNKLPQGSPASPIIYNLIARSLDSRLVALARDCKCTYTRYADDLTFSTNAPTFPEKIGLKHDGHSWVAGYSLVRLVENSGFGINTSKTRMQYRSSRQTVTGLSVNERVNVQRDYRRRV